MYRLRTKNTKTDPFTSWNLPDRVFFACGACHILAYAFSKEYPTSGFVPVWIRPRDNLKGNHIVMVRDDVVFDYHGYSVWPDYYCRYRRNARDLIENWESTTVELPLDVLVSEKRSREYDGLWLREPSQFLHNAIPRAMNYIRKYHSPLEYMESKSIQRSGDAQDVEIVD